MGDSLESRMQKIVNKVWAKYKREGERGQMLTKAVYETHDQELWDYYVSEIYDEFRKQSLN